MFPHWEASLTNIYHLTSHEKRFLWRKYPPIVKFTTFCELSSLGWPPWFITGLRNSWVKKFFKFFNDFTKVINQILHLRYLRINFRGILPWVLLPFCNYKFFSQWLNMICFIWLHWKGGCFLTKSRIFPTLITLLKNFHQAPVSLIVLLFHTLNNWN